MYEECSSDQGRFTPLQAKGQARASMHSSPRSKMGAHAIVASCTTRWAMGRSNLRDDSTRKSAWGVGQKLDFHSPIYWYNKRQLLGSSTLHRWDICAQRWVDSKKRRYGKHWLHILDCFLSVSGHPGPSLCGASSQLIPRRRHIPYVYHT